MDVTYDSKIDAAYIYIVRGANKRGRVAKTYSCDPSEVGGIVNLDFDKDGVLMGIEVLDASKKLPPEFLAKAIPSS